MARRWETAAPAVAVRTHPMYLASSMTTVSSAGRTSLMLLLTRPIICSARTMLPSTSSSGDGSSATTEQEVVRWLSRPQGDPSGVCTGHMNPHDSGRSFLTAVVRSSAKYAPRWIDRK